jgi:hypothetical protein
MNNLKKLACLVALSPLACAAEVSVGSALTVITSQAAQEDTGSLSLTGMMSSVSYYDATSSNAGVYGSANVFLSPSVVKDGGPRFANIGFGGTFNTAPGAKVKLGVIGQLEKSANAESEPSFTTGFQFAGLYELAEGYNVEVSSSYTFPLESEKGKATSAVSVGIAKSIDVVDIA